jgi:hypothetical protein
LEWKTNVHNVLRVEVIAVFEVGFVVVASYAAGGLAEDHRAKEREEEDKQEWVRSFGHDFRCVCLCERGWYKRLLR